MNMECGQILNMALQARLSQVEQWRQNPFDQPYCEVVRHMRVSNRKDGSYQGPQFIYKVVRDALRGGEAFMIGALSLSGGGKSTFLGTLYRLLRSDPYLKDELLKGINLKVYPVPFGVYTMAVHTERVKELYPDLHIPPQYHGANFDPSHNEKISALMKIDLEKKVLDDIPSDEARVALLETSSATSLPIIIRDTEGKVAGVKVENDRAHSSLYDFALKYSEQIEICAVEREQDVGDVAMELRRAMGVGNWVSAFQGAVKFVFTNKNGEEVDVRFLPEIHQDLANFLKKVTASPEVKERNDKQFLNFLDQLYLDGRINYRSQRSFLEILRNTLGMNNVNFHIISNRLLLGEKHYNLDYYFQSLPATLYPEIIPPALRAIL